MPPRIALIICAVFILWLLYTERKHNPGASFALWIPTIWMLICGSRPLSTWFVSGLAPFAGGDEQGSPLDRLVLSILIFLALVVVYRRNVKWNDLSKNNFWLILLYMYLGLTVIWSDFPGVSAKRWVRLLGLIPVVMVIASERSPLQSLESVLRRCAFVLIPLSYVLIHYFPLLGRRYGRWTGELMWVGVATQKNGLGQVCAISGLFLFWVFVRRFRSGDLFANKMVTLGDCLVLGMGLLLLRGPGGAYSATSIALFILTVFTVLVLYSKESLRDMVVTNLKTVLISLSITYLLFGKLALEIMTSLLGRDETLTGRGEIWEIVMAVASQNPVFGVGYGGFWGLGIDEAMATRVGQAHNGYLDVYLHTGIVGIMLLIGFLLALSSRLRKIFKLNMDWSLFGICLLLFLLLYNYTESAFLTPGFLWSLLISVTIVFSSATVGVVGSGRVQSL
jgi:exopolysaccharide production protein ExoQ